MNMSNGNGPKEGPPEKGEHREMPELSDLVDKKTLLNLRRLGKKIRKGK